MLGMLPSRKRHAADTVKLTDTVWDADTVDFASRAVHESSQAIPKPSLADQPCCPFPALPPPSLKELEPVLRQRFSQLRKRLQVQTDLRRRRREGPLPKRRRHTPPQPPNTTVDTTRQSDPSGEPLVVRMTEREMCRDVDELEHTLLWLALLDCTQALMLSGQEEARRHPEFTLKMRSTMERAKKALMMTYGSRYSQ